MPDINPLTPLVTAANVKVNAKHLNSASESDLTSVIADVHTIFIEDYVAKWINEEDKIRKLTVIEKLLAQHMATLNVRRADSESIAGMSKSISVPKDQDLDQTEYGQMARKMAQKLGLDWATDDKPACLRIY